MSNSTQKRSRPATSPEGRENQMISLAIDLAEQQLRDGTASSQVITHFLKLGSTKERLEKEIMANQRDLIAAKTKSYESMENIERMYQEAMDAMKMYQGVDESYDEIV